MRDTYADTSLARKDLGFAPKVSLEEGIEAEYRWLPRRRRWYEDAMTKRCDSDRDRAAGGAGRRAARAGGPKKPPVGTLEPDKFLFERGTENLEQETLARRRASTSGS